MDRNSFDLSRAYTYFCNDLDANFEVQKSLLLRKLCADCLTSNVYYISKQLSHCHKIPFVIYNDLIESALAANRVLSFVSLLKNYPREEFLLPKPIKLKKWPALDTHSNKLLFNSFSGNAISVLGVLRKIMFGHTEFQTSKLKDVDFNTFPLGSPFIDSLCSLVNDIESSEKRLEVSSKQFVLKVSLIITYQEMLTKVSHLLQNKVLKIILTGLNILNFHCTPLQDLLRELPSSELTHFNVTYISNSLPYLVDFIPKFKNLTNLNLIYITYLIRDSHTFDRLALALYELPQLACLGLRGCILTGHLGHLLSKNCNRNSSEHKKRKTEYGSMCCSIHRGNLKYLDLSFCQLNDEDLKCFEEKPFAERLQYLSLAYGKFNAANLAHCLEFMCSSIVFCDLEAAICKPSIVDPLLSMLKKFSSLRLLNLKCIKFEQHHIPLLKEAILSMPSLKHIELNLLRELELEFTEFIKSLKSEKDINIYLHTEV